MRIGLTVSALLMVIFQLLFTQTGKGQSIATEKVTLGLNDDSLATVINKIEQQSVFRFFYRSADVSQVRHLNLPQGTRTIEQTLKILLQNTALSFRQMDNNILLERKEQKTTGEIKGRVLNGADGEPVANASVFLSNATTGSASAADGTFTLSNIKPGKYDLVVSVIGFETYMLALPVDNSCKALPDIELSPKTFVLNEVSVNATVDPDREKNMEVFKDEFLGTSALASECKILNPEAIDLNYDRETGILTASSADFIKIENQALGYKIKYLLTDFIKINGYKNALKVQYSGSAFFEEMRGSPAQEKRWLKKRLEVYEGSTMHFLRSALNNSIEEEGFRALWIVNKPNPKRPADSLIAVKIKYYENLKRKNRKYRDTLAYWRGQSGLPKTIQTLEQTPLTQTDFVKVTNQKGLYALLSNNGALYVAYNKNHHFDPNERISDIIDPANKQSTVINFDIPYILFDKNGEIVNPDCVSFVGEWGKKRVAELLPVDYDPTQSIDAFTGNNSPQASENPVFYAQPSSLKAELLKIKTLSDTATETHSSEKLYMQFDKPYYAVNDTIWFKGWLLKASSLLPSDKSAIIYVDVANDSSKVVKHYSIPAQSGLGWGNISLDEKEFVPGTYTISAYTTWMRNFDSDYFFTKSFYITGPGETNWLVNKKINTTIANNIETTNVKLQLNNMDRSPEANKPVQLQVFAGNKHLFKQTIQTDQNGLLDFSLTFPQKESNFIIKAGDAGGKEAIISMAINRPEDMDIQFLPEGGNLVAGLTAHVGFKATGEDGKGVNISGIITGNNQNQVAAFKSLHNGMGSFYLAVNDAETYTAKVTLPDGSVKEYPLPAVKSTGTVLRIVNPIETDSLTANVEATKDLVQQGDSYFLIGRARGIVCYAAVINFRNGHFIKRNIAKSLFPTGIVHFTLMTTKGQPLNERMVFIDHGNLNIQLIPGKERYGARDSVALKIKVTDNTGEPVEGNFALAVTDNAMVKTDTLNNENIISRLLLTADLKGFVEQPGYYLSAKNPEVCQALDNLLLTQGWTGYDWGQVFNPPVLAYPHESEFKVKGHVFNVFNKPVKGTNVLLFSKSPAILMDTATNRQGNFVFDQFPRVDTPIFVIKAVNKKGESFNVGIAMDEITPVDFAKPAGPAMAPWYVNSDSTLINFTKSNALLYQQAYYKPSGHLLKEVNVTSKKIVKDSQNLNGSGNADFVLDEKDMEKAGKKTFLQIFEESIGGFKESYVLGNLSYLIHDKPIIIIVDGIRLSDLFIHFRFNDLKEYLESHDAEDIKGIEIMSAKYDLNYAARFGDIIGTRAYIEITTRSGHGPIIDNTPGMYLYKPLAISWPKQFYKPKYTIKDAANNIADLRSTIDWEPNIVTNARGEAKLWFYAAGKPSTYTITIEGSDMNGNLGFKTGKLIINTNKTTSVTSASTSK